MAPNASGVQAKRNHLWFVAKFAFFGALILGVVAFVHVWWDGYKFALSGEKPVDDPRLVTLSITAVGVVAGAVIGAAVGAVTTFVKWLRKRG
jgi:hypothetical protein